MKTEYQFYLPVEKEKSYQLMSGLIFIINLFAFSYMVVVVNPEGRNHYISLFGSGFSAACIYLQSKKIFSKKTSLNYSGFGFSLLAIIWMVLGKIIFGLCLVLFAVLFFYALKKIKIIISNGGIALSTLPSKFYSWSVIENVVLKDDMLTIDLKNNKLIQSVLDPKSDPVDEREFNLYCNRQIQNEL